MGAGEVTGRSFFGVPALFSFFSDPGLFPFGSFFGLLALLGVWKETDDLFGLGSLGLFLGLFFGLFRPTGVKSSSTWRSEWCWLVLQNRQWFLDL